MFTIGPVRRVVQARCAIVTTAVIGAILTTAHCGTDSTASPASAIPPAPAKLAFATQPATVSAGASMVPAVRVVVEDAAGDTAATSAATVTLALVGGDDSTKPVVGGTLSRNAVHGVATFDDLTIDRAGTVYFLRASATGLTSATSEPFRVIAGAARKLEFTVQPASAPVRLPIAPIVQVAVQDAEGNTVATSTATVTVTLAGGTGPPGAALSGTLNQVVSGGIAYFADLTIEQPSAGYALKATAPNLTGTTSDSFSVTPWTGAPTSITLQSDPGDYVGEGLSYHYTQANAVVTVAANGDLLGLRVIGDEGWVGDFEVPNSLTQLAVGTYSDLAQYPFNAPAAGGLSWYGQGRACAYLTGWFAIDSLAYRNGTVVDVALRFEQRCAGYTSALHGSIHWDAADSTMPPGPVLPIPDSLWAPAAGAVPASGDYLYLQPDSGAYGGGATLTLQPPGSTIAFTAQAGHLVVLVDDWQGYFYTMNTLSEFQRGYYPGLHEAWYQQGLPAYNPAKGRLRWLRQGEGCSNFTGWFVVDDATYVGTALTGIDLRFEQHCDGEAPALHGAIHWRQ